MAAIIREDPEPLPATVPSPLRRVVERCLAKDPAERYDSTKDLHRELKLARERLSESSARGLPAQSVARHPKWKLWGAAALAALAIAAVSVAASRMIWRTPEPPTWSGVMLGGSEISQSPRLSPDGNLIAFQAMVEGLVQVAVMKPESGNWSVLTHARDQGNMSSLSWSKDGTLIYYDRYTDVPRGIYGVPVLGGDERLVVENAVSPEALPDGSLLIIIIKLNAERKFQLHRFWPGTGRVQALPILFPGQNFYLSSVRADSDGKTAVAWVAPIGLTASGPGLLAVDLSSGAVRRLNLPGLTVAKGFGFPFARDGKSVVALVNSGALTRFVRVPISNDHAATQLFTTTSIVWTPEAGLGETVYASIVDRPAEVVRFAPDGSAVERLASFTQTPDPVSMTVLPDGRAVLPVIAYSQVRLMVVQKGKDPAPLVNTTEETAGPVAACGPREIAFMIGPPPHDTITIANPPPAGWSTRLRRAKGRWITCPARPTGKRSISGRAA
jgi:hypothetical protein